MPTSTHGKLSCFHPETESWTSYCERLGFYFATNDLSAETYAEKRKAILLLVCGAPTYDLLWNLIQPEKVADKTYDKIVAVLKKHYKPKQSVIAQRYKFNTRVRLAGESVSAYVAALKSLGEHCEFNSLEEMVRNRLVCGVGDAHMQRAMLQEADLTYKKALQLCTATELATNDITLLLQKQGDESLKLVKGKQNGHCDSQRRNCYHYGANNHSSDSCHFKTAECCYCKKIGHIAKVCKSKLRQPQQEKKRLHLVKHDSSPTALEPPSQPQPSQEHFATVGGKKPIVLTINVNKVDLPMELDTGASISVINEVTYYSFFRSCTLKPSAISLKSYTGQDIVVLGEMSAHVEYAGQKAVLPLVVVKGQGASLFGRNWLEVLKLDWPSIKALHLTSPVGTLISKHQALFSSQLGTLKGTTAKILVKPTTAPRFFRPRPVPYCLREKVEKELERLVKMKIITPVYFSDWAAPVVPVVKQDGSIRLCGDYKVTINQVAKTELYPLPRIEDLFTALAGGKIFIKLDLSHAYQQVILHEESRKYTTINTHRELFEFCHLPFGISSAPAIFQRIMDNLLQGLPMVCIYLDYILLAGVDETDHLKNLSTVLNKLEQAGLILKESKCVFASSSMEYLGHIIDGQGLHPSPTKVEAVKKAPVPTNVTELKSFIGLINYYHKFLPQFSTVLAPLYQLLHKDSKWEWSATHNDAYNKAKDLLQSSSLLVHFDPQKPLVMACDASPYGIGAVLAHRMPDNSEKPIAYVSRTLAKAEKQYSQLEKEVLAIIFAVKRFHQFLFGNHFTLYSDHKPLEQLLNEAAPIPPMALSRIQRWALILSAYHYNIQHRPGQSMGNADALSCLFLPSAPEQVPVPGDVLLSINHIADHVVTSKHLLQWTNKDLVLSQVRRLVQAGCPIDDADAELRPYQQRYSKISVVDGCVLLGSHVVIPKEGRELVLKQLHISHRGICRMKGLARSYVWWPGIDQAIEDQVCKCHICQLHQANPPKAPLHPLESPKQPWSQIPIDHAGPFLNKHYLIIIDSYTKWLDVHIVPSTSSKATFRVLQSVFATHGCPEQLVSDNGSGFISSEFKSFLASLGVQYIQTSPYHASSNGLAERAVQIFKSTIKKLDGDIQTRINTMLFQYRVTPQMSTGLSPAEMLMGRKLRNTLDLLHPDMLMKLNEKSQSWSNKGQASKCRTFNVGDFLLAHNYRGKSFWIPATVVKITGRCSYIVKSSDDILLQRHIDQLRPNHSTKREPQNTDDWPLPHMDSQPVSLIL